MDTEAKRCKAAVKVLLSLGWEFPSRMKDVEINWDMVKSLSMRHPGYGKGVFHIEIDCVNASFKKTGKSISQPANRTIQHNMTKFRLAQAEWLRRQKLGLSYSAPAKRNRNSQVPWSQLDPQSSCEEALVLGEAFSQTGYEVRYVVEYRKP